MNSKVLILFLKTLRMINRWENGPAETSEEGCVACRIYL
jgi:hypothetical protein